MGGKVDKIKETIGAKLPPEPAMQPENEWYSKLPKKITENNVIWYWFVETGNSKEGQWVPEPVAKIWYYGDQIKYLNAKLLIVDGKIKIYANEINRIDEYIAQQKMNETQEEIKEESLRKRIESLERLKKKLKGEGCTERDISYRKTQYQIDQLMKQLSPKTPSSEEKMHIASWPLEPGQAPVAGQDLYVIRGAHRAKIKNIEKNEKLPIENEISVNQAYKDYWQEIYNAILNPKKK